MTRANASLLLFLSKARDLPSAVYTFPPTGEVFNGVQTNDAPVECLMKKAKENGTEIGSIFCITTKEAKSDIVLNGKTSIQIFEETVLAAGIRLGYQDVPTIYEIPYQDFENGTLHKRQIAYRIFNMIHSRTGSDSDIYIDYTGGYRDICLLMTSIIRYMEFQNIRCRMILFSDPYGKVLHEIHFMYDMFELVNSVDQFVTTGSASKLNDFYQEHEASADIQKVTKAITDFSNNIRLCSLSKLDKSVIRLADALNTFESAEDDLNYYTALFQSLIPMIRRKMYLDDLITEINGKRGLNYPVLIQWCLDHDLLQQALTLYVEKLPIYYYQKEYIPHVLSDYDPSDPALAGKAASLFYDVYDVIADMPQTRLLAEDMKRTGETWDDSRTLEERLENIVNTDRPVAFRRAYQRLLNTVREQKTPAGVTLQYYGRSTSIPIPVESTYNTILNNGKEGCHYLLFDDQEAFRKIPQRDKSNDNRNNYRKKEYAAELLAEKTEMTAVQKETVELLENREYLKDILLYYLIVKMVRNHTNHATETLQSPDEAGTWKKLRNSFSIRYDGSFQSVKDLVQEGLTCSIRRADPPERCTADVRRRYEKYYCIETVKDGEITAPPIDEEEAISRLLSRYGKKS